MPKRPWPIWLLAGVLLLSEPVAEYIHWTEVLHSGQLSEGNDLIIIPIGQSVVASMILAPLVMWITHLCVRRYNPRSRLLGWDRHRAMRSGLLSLVFGGAAAGMTVFMITILVDYYPFFDLPWYEYLWVICWMLPILWLLILRAAAVAQRLDLENEPGGPPGQPSTATWRSGDSA